MASSTSCYDVFLSFRGEDTRHSFTDHLYHKLIHAGVCTFRDEEDINRGQELKPEIETAIKSSRSSIVVLSENYATSTWCLDELVLILEQRRVFSHFVLPVFYHVNPRDVRKQIGSFEVEKDRWKIALTEVASLSGFTMSGPETSTLNEIVEMIYHKLDEKEVHLPLNITGMASRYKEISSWLDQCNAEFLAIYGMGGSGKTTLAKYIYNLKRRSFEYVSFVENIGNRCETYNDLLELQKQLVKDILGGKKRKVPSISRGMCMIEEVLQTNRTLIVLDDIVEKSQLVALLGTGKINALSKIIITTRENIDNWFDFPYWRCQKYEMRLLNPDESLELFCRHAFQSEIHGEGYDSVVKYCEGNPLALEVLGSSMSKYNAHMIMPSQLRLFEIDMDSRIQSVLMRSYLSLPCNTVKELFLHIACFFIGIDIDYVVKILEPDYAAQSGIETLLEKCLLSVSPNKKVMMHRLLQEMAKSIVRQESTKLPAKRSRVWLSSDSYNILNKRKGSETIEGLALDMKMLQKEKFAFKASQLKTDALKNMEILKLLQLNFAELSGSYEYAFENLRWLCWHGFHLTTIPSDLYMGNLVAIDMSYSKLEVFEPPTVLQSLQILNLKDSHDLTEIRNILKIPNLHTLVLWNCKSLVNVSDDLRDLSNLELLNMTGCKNLFNMEQIECKASASGEVVKKLVTFSFPFSLHRLFLRDCYIQRTHSVPLNFSGQPHLQYLNVSNSLFESLPCYGHLENLRVLDLSCCSRLKCLLCLPSTLAELYIYHCESLEKITFDSHRFPLQEFGYEGCVNLYEIEDYLKLVPIAKLDENDLGHMEWLKEYQNHEVCLVGDDELTVGRSWRIQMLYEFNIMSISLPDINDPNMTPEYRSESSHLSFNVPSCPKNKRLIGINITSKYSISGDEWAWFCKVNTTNGVVDLMYHPKVFGKPESGEVCIWLSYWPIGNTLDVGNTVDVSIVVLSGLEVHECGVSFVYSDKETMESNLGWEEIVVGDLSRFELSTGAYYLCRRDFFQLMEVGRLTPDWFKILVGDTIDYTEVRGWSETGRPKQVNPSFSELKTIRCIIHGSQLEDIYNITEMSKLSIGDKTVAFTSSLIDEESESIVETMEEQKRSMALSETLVSDENKESDSTPHQERLKSVVEREPSRGWIPAADKQLSLADFDKVKIVGKGKGGIVELVKHKRTGQFFVLKVIQMDVDEPSRKQITKELKINQSSQCPNVVACYQSFYDNGVISMILEYMDGGSLADFLKTVRSVPEHYLAAICKQVLKGLWYIHHEKHIIHRDLKPSNLLINHRGEVKIADFGVSAILASASGLANTQIGTFNYMSPERIIGGSYGNKSDVWSLGLVLLECATGKFPYSPPQGGEGWVGFYELMETVVGQPPPHAPSDKFSPQFCSFIGACLQKDPKDRASSNELMSHPFISMYDNMEVDLASYFTEAGSLLQRSTESLEQKQSMALSETLVSGENKESDSTPHRERLKSVVKKEPGGDQTMQKIVLGVDISSEAQKRKMLKKIIVIQGVESIALDMKEGKLTVIGVVDIVKLVKLMQKIANVTILSVGPAREGLKPGYVPGKEDKARQEPLLNKKPSDEIVTSPFSPIL